jgi:SAM-dependent methyltransferase
MAGHMRRFVHDLRTEGGGPGRDAAAVGLGVFIGSLPFYGFHLLLCIGAGTLLRLNRVKLYLAANISNPLMAPFLILSELQTGALVTRGELRPLTLDAVKQIDPWSLGADILIGAVIVGALLGLALGTATWMLTRDRGEDPLFAALVRRASDRFVAGSITAWEFARGKLRGDPLYRTVLLGRVLPTGAPNGTLVDVGCGSGLMLALLAEAAACWREGRWPRDRAAPPLFDRLVGIELRERVARLARRVLGDAATILEEDARRSSPLCCDAILFFDVLHMMLPRDQEQLLSAMTAQLSPSGVILVREADAGAGWRFRAVRIGNRVKAIAFGRWGESFHYRSASEWKELFERFGFAVARRDAGQGTPFANELFVLTRAADPLLDSGTSAVDEDVSTKA